MPSVYNGYRLTLDCLRIVAAVAFGYEAVEAFASTVGLLAARKACFGQPVGAAA